MTEAPARPVWQRVAAAAAAMAAATGIELAMRGIAPWRAELAIAAALGALAAWPFTWRARSRADHLALGAGVLAFGAGMVWLRMNGHVASQFAFLFSVILLSIPVQRARGRLSPGVPGIRGTGAG